MSILYHISVGFLILSYTFLVILFFQDKQFISWIIYFRKFSDVLPAITCAGNGNLWSLCFGG